MDGTCLTCRNARVTPGVRGNRLEPPTSPEAQCRIEDEVKADLQAGEEVFDNADIFGRPILCRHYDEVKVPYHALWA